MRLRHLIQLFSLLILLDMNGGIQKVQRCREKIFPKRQTTAYKNNPSLPWTSPQQTSESTNWDGTVPVPTKIQERAVHPHKPFSLLSVGTSIQETGSYLQPFLFVAELWHKPRFQKCLTLDQTRIDSASCFFFLFSIKAEEVAASSGFLWAAESLLVGWVVHREKHRPSPSRE